MSDGPHRSLNMKPAWRGLAARADNSAFDEADLREAMHRAARSDFRNEVPPRLIMALNRIFDPKQGSLAMPELVRDELRKIEPLAAGSVFGTNLHMWAVHMAEIGRVDRAALEEAVGHAALERAYGGIRQVSEHYLRESSRGRTGKVAARIEGALATLSASELGGRLLRASPRNSLRHADLDEGVALSVR